MFLFFAFIQKVQKVELNENFVFKDFVFLFLVEKWISLENIKAIL